MTNFQSIHITNSAVNSISTDGGIKALKGCLFYGNSCFYSDLLVTGSTKLSSLLVNESIQSTVLKVDSMTSNTISVDSVFVSQKLNVLQDSNFSGSIMISGGLHCSCTTESVSLTTGSFVISGGMAVNGNIFTKGNLTVGNACYFSSGVTVFGSGTFYSSNDSISPSTGGIVLAGGLGVMKSCSIGGNLTVSDILVNGGIDAKDLKCDSILVNSLIKSSDLEVTNSVSAFSFTGITGIFTNSLQTGKIDAGSLSVTDLVNCNFLKSNSVSANSISCNSVKFTDNNGLFTIKSDFTSGLRISLSDSKSISRYYTSIDFFSLGNSYVSSNFEALQISNDQNGNWNINSRANGTGSSGSVSINSSVTISKEKMIIETGSIEILDGNQKYIRLQVNDLDESYILILPTSPPPVGIVSVLACDGSGKLFWKVS